MRVDFSDWRFNCDVLMAMFALIGNIPVGVKAAALRRIDESDDAYALEFGFWYDDFYLEKINLEEWVGDFDAALIDQPWITELKPFARSISDDWIGWRPIFCEVAVNYFVCDLIKSEVPPVPFGPAVRGWAPGANARNRLALAVNAAFLGNVTEDISAISVAFQPHQKLTIKVWASRKSPQAIECIKSAHEKLLMLMPNYIFKVNIVEGEPRNYSGSKQQNFIFGRSR